MTKQLRQLTENTKLLHKVALIHNNEVLILKRSTDSTSRADKWDLAGGNSEWPENNRQGHGVHQEDIVREIVEETGIEVSPDIFDFSALTFFDTFFDPNKQVFTIICGWRYRLPTNFDHDRIIISSEHSQIKWITEKETDLIDFGGHKGVFVRNIIKNGFKEKK